MNADRLLERLADGSAHADAIVMVTTTLDQIRGRRAGSPMDMSINLAQTEVYFGDEARAAAALLDLAGFTATVIGLLAEQLGASSEEVLEALARVQVGR